MRLSLRQLEIFVAVADRGATGAAGDAIALSQSAVSSGLLELEGVLGTPLFDRIGKGLALSAAGTDLLPDARSLLADARSIEGRFGPNGDGATRRPVRLGIAASTTIGNYLLPPRVAAFAREEVDARIDVKIGNTREVEAAVARFQVDFGFIEGPSHEDQLAVTPWIEDRLVVVAASSHPLARVRRVTVSDLREATWLLREVGSGTREAVEHALLPQLHRLDSRMHFGGTEAIKQAVAEGLGITCLSIHAVGDLVALDRLVVLKTTLRPMRRAFYRVHHRRKRFSAGAERFIAFCAQDARSASQSR